MPTPPPPIAYIEAGRLHKTEGNRPHGSGKQDLEGMAETIRLLGVLVPLLIRPHPRREGHFVIMDGHRRYEAGQMAGLVEFPCTMRRTSELERQVGPVLTEVVVQTQRVPWGPVEFALKLGQLLDGGLSAADIARYTGMAEGTVSYHLELLELDGDTLQRVRNGQIPVGAAHEAVKAVRAAAPAPTPGPREIQPRRRTGPAGQQRKPRSYWDATHPLAPAARELCTSHGHRAWERLGKVACGPCWEEAVRQDQDTKRDVDAAMSSAPTSSAPMPQFQQASGL